MERKAQVAAVNFSFSLVPLCSYVSPSLGHVMSGITGGMCVRNNSITCCFSSHFFSLNKIRMTLSSCLFWLERVV